MLDLEVRHQLQTLPNVTSKQDFQGIQNKKTPEISENDHSRDKCMCL